MKTKSHPKVQILTSDLTGKTLWHVPYAIAWRGNAAAEAAMGKDYVFRSWSVMGFKTRKQRDAQAAKIEQIADRAGAAVERSHREPGRGADGNAYFLVQW